MNQIKLEDDIFNISAEAISDQEFKVIIKKGEDTPEEFTLVNLDIDIFRKLAQNKIGKLLGGGVPDDLADNLNSLITKEFISIYSWHSSQESPAPLAGIMSFKNEITLRSKVFSNIDDEINSVKKKIIKQKRKKRIQKLTARRDFLINEFSRIKDAGLEEEGYISKFKIESITMEILDGSIRVLLVQGSLDVFDYHYDEEKNEYSERKVEELRTYRNFHPIGISSFSDVEAMSQVQLRNLHDPFDGIVLKLSDLITYVPSPSLKSDDYSPKNNVYHVKADANDDFSTSIELYKEETKYLFVGRIYSDLIGLSDSQPNGLIQTEVSKKVVVNSQENAFVIFNYVQPKLTISKIDNKELELPVREDSVIQVLDLYQRSFMRLETNLNVMRLDLPSYKFTIKSNFGVGIIGTVFENSDLGEKGVKPSLKLHSSLILEFRPDSRWDFDIRFSLNKFSGFNSGFDYQDSWIRIYEFNASFRPNQNQINQVFYRLSVVNDTRSQDFFQAQVGYSFPLVKAK
ncbi:MAG: hypothetical protein ABJH72_24650 [Reichenbachiella sp.]|uniref:hypothetical protein n=1 Tax=Reichenbachiella sp. TaxID=2184521 RepID=UPI003296B9F3